MNVRLTKRQMVFLIDLPRLDKAADHKPTMFTLELDRFLRAMGIEDRMVDSLSNYDFSRTSNLGFVHSRSVPLPGRATSVQSS